MSIENPTKLPRYSNAKDVDEFVSKLEAFERGEIGPDEFRAFRLLRGVYGQRQENAQMVRVKLPMGRAAREQLLALADVAERYARGFGHVTTRQNIQYHFVQMKNVEAAMRRCDEAGITTREACGNSVRNVTSCELAEVCSKAPFDVTPYAESLVRQFLGHPLSSSLPRKFKIAFSGCEHDCAYAAIHDLGVIAKVKDGQRGFAIVCGGGLSSAPQNALRLHDFVPAGELSRVGEALVRLFHALGNRENRHRARLKYVVKKLGDEGFRKAYAEHRAAVDAEALAELVEAPPLEAKPAAPVLDDGPRLPGYLAWRATNVIDQKQEGYVAVYIRLHLGDVTAAQMRGLADVLLRFGDGTLRLTIDQNLLLPWVDQRSLPALYRVLESLGLARPDIHTARDVTACQGADTCSLAVTGSRPLATEISQRLEKESPEELVGLRDTVIKVSGCPNSCGQHHIADLGFHGAAKTFGEVTVPMYQLHLGGGVDGNGAVFGRQVVKLIARRVPEAVVSLLRLFQSDRKPDETPASFFRRVDAKRVKEVLAPLLGGPEAGDEFDIGQTEGFLVQNGVGECAG